MSEFPALHSRNPASRNLCPVMRMGDGAGVLSLLNRAGHATMFSLHDKRQRGNVSRFCDMLKYKNIGLSKSKVKNLKQ